MGNVGINNVATMLTQLTLRYYMLLQLEHPRGAKVPTSLFYKTVNFVHFVNTVKNTFKVHKGCKEDSYLFRSMENQIYNTYVTYRSRREQTLKIC